MTIKNLPHFCIAVLMSGLALAEPESGFVSLFDGKSIEGWVKRGGDADYEVKDGAIVGYTKPNTPNTFLCTARDYGDFILEYEFKVHPKLNSGVQFRSKVFDKETEVELANGDSKTIPANRVHGYQCEIDANKPERSWMSGVYDEARRGWLFPGAKGGNGEAFTEQGTRLFKPEEWNSVRIECRGNQIQTYLNGELRADFTDSMTASGFIGLQVHGVGKETERLYAMWKNIRIKEL